jgi:sulfite reductase alpha subunit-like flavoprotein
MVLIKMGVINFLTLVYVQDYLKKKKIEIFNLIIHKKSYIFLCGGFEMIKDIKKIILDILKDFITDEIKDKYDFNDEHEYLEKMIFEKRLKIDQWN